MPPNSQIITSLSGLSGTQHSVPTLAIIHQCQAPYLEVYYQNSKSQWSPSDNEKTGSINYSNIWYTNRCILLAEFSGRTNTFPKEKLLCHISWCVQLLFSVKSNHYNGTISIGNTKFSGISNMISNFAFRLNDCPISPMMILPWKDWVTNSGKENLR